MSENNNVFFIIPYGIGDAIICFGLKEAIEKRYNHKITFVVKKSQEPLIKMFNIKDYRIKNFSNEELQEIAANNPVPTPGNYFVGHPHFGKYAYLDNSFLSHEISFTKLFTAFLDLDGDTKLNIPKLSVTPCVNIKEKYKIKDFNRLILVLPEVKSASPIERLQDDFFLKKITEFENKGFQVLVNTEKKDSLVYGNRGFFFSLEELLFLSSVCHKVIAARSGICDLIYTVASNLYIFYPNVAFYDLFKMEQIFENKRKEVTETVFSLSEKLKSYSCHSVSLYGYGNAGKRVFYSLKKEDFNVDYIIDKQMLSPSGVKTYQPQEILPHSDLVIVTIREDRENIINTLKNNNLEYVFLEDIMKG